MDENNGEILEKTGEKNATPDSVRQNDVADVAAVKQREAMANTAETHTKTNECEIPMKKRKTRRGKHKRRYPPYNKNERNKSGKVVTKPEAPYNSNQFLLEDHGIIEELDENLRHADQISTTSNCRTRDSSFSVDSDGEFYSSPDDEEQFLIKDFVDQYESVQAERLQSMSKDELIREYLLLESKLEILTKRQKNRKAGEGLEDEVERLLLENEALRHENAALKSKCTTSEDSESDSSTSDDTTCSSSSCSSEPETAHSPVIDYSKTNGHATSVETV